MGKIVLFIVFSIFVLLFPLYENSKITLPSKTKTQKELSLANIYDGIFYVYEKNLSKSGEFKLFSIFKNRYLINNLSINDFLKKEKYFAKKAVMENGFIKAFDFKYHNLKYNFYSDYIVYNLKTKSIFGNKFFLYSNEYNSSGKNFFIDSKRNIEAENISFYLKVNK